MNTSQTRISRIAEETANSPKEIYKPLRIVLPASLNSGSTRKSAKVLYRRFSGFVGRRLLHWLLGSTGRD